VYTDDGKWLWWSSTAIVASNAMKVSSNVLSAPAQAPLQEHLRLRTASSARARDSFAPRIVVSTVNNG